MKLFTKSALLLASFVLLVGSCTLEDHARPAPSVYTNCRLSTESRYVAAKILSGEDIKVGDRYYAATIYDAGKPFIVSEIVVEDGKSYALGTFPYKLDYEYNTEGEIIKTVDNNPSDTQTTYYQYVLNQLKTRETYNKSSDIRRTFDLNSAGLVAKISVGFEPNLIETSTSTYDENGYLIERRNSEGRITTYTILNGNIVKEEYNHSSGKTVIEYEYDLSRPNLPNPLPFFGKESHNLLVKVTTTSNSETYQSEYKYIFDTEGRVKRMIKKFLSAKESSVQGFTDFTYTCQ